MARLLNNPQLGSTVTEFPVPILDSTIESEIVSMAAGKYEPLEYGLTRFNSVDHGDFPKDLPNHFLVYDAPYNQEGTLRKRVWVNDRIDQDRYNFKIDYEGNNPEFPLYIRTYIVRRDGYTPLVALSKDPVDEYALLISEQVLNETQPAELTNALVKVVRIYQTLPGLITYSIEYPYGGMSNFPRITTKQKVATGHAIPAPSASGCPVEGYQSAALITQSVKKTDNFNVDELNNVYEMTPPISAQTGYGYNLEYMDGSVNHPVLIWTFSVLRSLYSPAVALSACPIAGFETLRLVDQKVKGDPVQDIIISVERRYQTVPGPLSHQVDYDNNDFLYPIVKTKQWVAKSEYAVGTAGLDACPVAGYQDLVLFEQHILPTEFQHVVEDQRIYEKTPNSVITTHDYDSDLDAIVTTTRQKIVSGQTPITTDLTLALEEQPVDKWRTLQIISVLTDLPPTKVEHQTGRFPFPTLLTGITLVVVELTSSTDSAVIWYPNTLRPLQNVPAVFRVTTEFFIGEPPTLNIFVMPTRDVIFRGRSFQIAINNVLCDEIEVSATFSGDAVYGDLTEGITFAATNPSATDYYAAIGTYQLIGVDITKYRGNIWSTQKTEVQLA